MEQMRSTVLVVNDEPKVLELLTVLLERDGYKVVTAESGSRALELALALEPDVVVSDIVMPEMDGFELCRRLKQDPRTAFVPVLLASAVRTGKRSNLTALTAGADDFLEMPFRRQELLVKVARLTERHRIESRYREIVEQASDIIYTRDMDGRLVSINEAGSLFFGRPASELIGAHLSDLFGGEVTARIIAQTEKIADTPDKSLRWVHRVKDARGILRYLEGALTLTRDAAGNPTVVRTVVRDITERKEAEERLRESEERYRRLVELSPEAIIVHIEGELVYLNAAGMKLLGAASSDQVIGKPILDFVHPDYLETVKSRIQQVREEGTQTELIEEKFVRLDGQIIDVEVAGVPISYAGKPAIQIVVREITERKRMEEERAVIFEIIQGVIATPNLDELLKLIHRSISKLLYAENCFVVLHDETTGLTHFEFWVDKFDPIPPPRPLGKGLNSYVLRTGRALLLTEELKARLYRQGEVEKSGTSSASWLGVPLRTPSRTIGVLVVQHYEQASAYSQRDLEFLSSVGSQIALAIERKRAEENLAQQVERVGVVNRISNAVRRSLDPTEVFRTAVRELGSYLAVDRCSIFVKDEKAGRVRMLVEYHAPGVHPANQDFPLARLDDLIGGVDQHGALAFDDVAHDERIREIYDGYLRAAGVRSIMYVGIRVGDEMPAAFAFSTTRSLRHWRDADIALARDVANQTGLAIRQAELYQKAEATSARESLINRLSLAIRASLSLPEVLNTATRELGRALKASRVHLYMYDPDHPRARAEHEYFAPNASSIKHLEMDFDEPIAQRILRSPVPVVIDNALDYENGPADFNSHVHAHAAQVGLRSQIIYPLIVNGRFRSALCIHQTDRVRHWTEDELALVEAVAAQLATGIAQAELFEMTGRAKKEWETTFNAMSDGIFIFDNSGQLIRVNRAGAAMEDTWPHLMLGRRCCDILRTTEGTTCIVEKTISEGRSVTLEVVPERFNRPLLVTVEPISEKGSKTLGAVCTARDLSELRKAEATAREHQSLLTNILESARESIYAVNTEGRFQWCNAATIAATGYKSEDLIGHSFLDITFEGDREIARAHFERTLEGKPQTYEARFFSFDGNLRHALFDTAPLIVDGHTTGVLGIARDITEQKQERQRAAQADKLRALGQLASGVAHDFNNALTAILGRAQLMRRQVKDVSLTHNLDVIQTAAEDAAATVRRIQTFARQSPAKEFELLDASSLLRDAIEITRTRWQNEARLRGLRYDVELHAEYPNYVLGSASELREVFVNLIVNAVDAMPLGGQLTISCERTDDRLTLSFTDTGLGMTEDVRERIFEPFYTTKGALGTGLGLAVSYGIIERHEGVFNVESEVGRGTTFEIRLPAADQTSAIESKPATPQGMPAMKMLVIDDEEFVRETLADMLTMLGHSVTAVEGGREALEKLSAENFELVFTDLSMPGMDGWEVAREIRRRFGADLSIILVTGHGIGTPVTPGDEHLINGIIGKPFDFDQVSEIIATVTQQGSGIGDQGTERENQETTVNGFTPTPVP